MTAAGLLVPVLTHLAGFIAFLAIPLLALSLFRMIGSR